MGYPMIISGYLEISLVLRLSDWTKATKGRGKEKAVANESLVSTVLQFIRFIAQPSS